MTLRSKLLLMLLPTSLLSMGTVALLGYESGKQSLTQQATEKVVAVRASKKQQIETYFRTLRDTFGVFGEDVAVVSAMGQFKDGFNQLGRTRLSDERRRKLEAYYTETVVPEIAAKSPSEPLLLENFWPRTDKAVEAQVLFLAENPNKPSERAKLLDHPISNPFTLAHFTYHGWFRDVAQRLKLVDLMLVDAESGAMVYSVAKEPDFATSLLDGPHANASIGHLFRQVRAEHKKGYVRMVDFENYAASGLAPTMFIATPVYANFKLTGVLIGQLSVEEINRTLNGEKSWRQDGLGETGLALVTGPSMRLRNDHRGFIENKETFFGQLQAVGTLPPVLQAMTLQNSTILKLVANIEGVRRALRGETGTVTAADVVGASTLQAYTPLNITDLNWVLLAQVNETEILAPQIRFQRNMMILACTLALLTTLAAMLLASRFLRPVNQLIDGIERLRSGATDVQLPKQSDDEFGRLTENFNAMSSAIRARDQIIADKSTAHDVLLRRMFPQTVADRLRKGDTQIVDTVSNVTVIYASIIGFVKATEGMDAVQSMTLLSELFDIMDALAAEHGVDRVKTLAEHYVAAAGLSVPRLDHAQRALAFCDALALEIARISKERNLKFQLRASLASGDITAGLVGNQRFVFDIWGRPLNLVRRLVHEASSNEVRASEETYALLGPGLGFQERPAVAWLTLGTIRSYGRPLGAATGAANSALVPRAAE